MDALIDPFWRLYPAALLMAVGIAAVAWGMRREIDGLRRPLRDPNKTLTLARGFRLGIIGLTLAGIGAASIWHLTWLLVLALAISGEELLESTIIIPACRQAGSPSPLPTARQARPVPPAVISPAPSDALPLTK